LSKDIVSKFDRAKAILDRKYGKDKTPLTEDETMLLREVGDRVKELIELGIDLSPYMKALLRI